MRGDMPAFVQIRQQRDRYPSRAVNGNSRARRPAGSRSHPETSGVAPPGAWRHMKGPHRLPGTHTEPGAGRQQLNGEAAGQASCPGPADEPGPSVFISLKRARRAAKAAGTISLRGPKRPFAPFPVNHPNQQRLQRPTRRTNPRYSPSPIDPPANAAGQSAAGQASCPRPASEPGRSVFMSLERARRAAKRREGGRDDLPSRPSAALRALPGESPKPTTASAPNEAHHPPATAPHRSIHPRPPPGKHRAPVPPASQDVLSSCRLREREGPRSAAKAAGTISLRGPQRPFAPFPENHPNRQRLQRLTGRTNPPLQPLTDRSTRERRQAIRRRANIVPRARQRLLRTITV